MKGKAIIPLVLGLCVGLFAVRFLMDTLKNAKASNDAKQKISVVRARQDIGAYEQITKEMVELVETNDNLFAPQAERVATIDEAVGRVTAKAIPQRMPVLQSMLGPVGTEPGTKGRIPPGFRAVSVKIDEVTGVAFQLRPGDWVDVIVVMDVEAGERGRNKETIAEVILQHVQVAAIGQSSTNPPEDGGGSKVKPAKSATLLVPEMEAPKLHLAATRGKITLAMRGSDESTSQTPGFASSNEAFPGLRKLLAPADAPPTPIAALATPAPGSRAVMANPNPPHGVVVYHGSTSGNQPGLIEKIVFENARSQKIIDVGSAPINRSAGARPQSKPQGGQPAQPVTPPQNVADEADAPPPSDEPIEGD